MASSSTPNVSLNAAGEPVAVHNLEFPPFPHLQSTVPVLPFADFVPKGTQIKDDADQSDPSSAPELDGEGVPTIMLNVRHDPDRIRKKGGSKTQGAFREDGSAKPWFEQWADNEPLMTAERLDPSRHTAYECIIQADLDFQQKRNLPLPVQTLYNELRVFIGIIDRVVGAKKSWSSRTARNAENPPPSASPARETVSDDEADVDDDDDDASTSPAADVPRPAATAPEEEDYTGALPPYQERTDLSAIIRFEQFLADPALAMKVFLSHHFRNRGLYWLEWNLYAGPIIAKAFLDFLLRHRLLASEYDEGLKAAVAVVDQAKAELPATKRAARALRDGWGTVCVDIWGAREEFLWGASLTGTTSDANAWWNESDEGYVTELSTDAPPAATLVDVDGNHVTADVESGEVQLPNHDDEEPVTLPATIPKDKDVSYKPSVDSLRTVVDAAPSSSGASTAAHPTEPEVQSGWFDGPANSSTTTVPHANPDANADAGGATWGPQTEAPSMFTYVGCASFPLTHAPVRAERSVRTILAVNPPMNLKDSSRDSPVSLLQAKLASVVLGPWKGKGVRPDGWVGGADDDGFDWEVSKPEMLRMEASPTALNLPTSTASDATSSAPSSEAASHIAQFFLPGEPGSAHSPDLDVITVFVDPAVVPELTVGLGVGGIFVQVAKRLDAPSFPAIKDGNSTEPKRGGKGKSSPEWHEKAGRSWWYIDSVSQVIPSYWTDLNELPVINPDDVA